MRNLPHPGASLAAGLSLAGLAGLAVSARAQDGGGQVVRCVSADGSRVHCAAYTAAGVALRESLGTSACLLGRNWGYDADGVWVTEGCGARFVFGNPAAESQRLAAISGDAAPVIAASVDAAGERSLGDYRFYSRLGAQTAFANSETELQDASSRIGVEYSVGEEIRLFAAGEWSVRLTGNENPFNPGASTSSGFIVLDAVDADTFGSRLGYVGVDFDEWGRVAFGKQEGVHYDVTSYTDRFNVFGADASATFTGGTDGGFTGTGRADSVVSYRNTFAGRLEFGAQLQMRDLSLGESVDGYGASVQLRLLDGLEAGVSYTRTLIDDSLKGAVLGLDDDAEFLALGLRYDSARLKLAAVYARQSNGDLERLPVIDQGESILFPIVFDADGLEIFGRYDFASGLGLLGGYLNYDPRLGETIGQYLNRNAELEYYVAGIDYRWYPNALFFAEYRYSDGVDLLGASGGNALVLGFQYWFSKSGTFTYP